MGGDVLFDFFQFSKSDVLQTLKCTVTFLPSPPLKGVVMLQFFFRSLFPPFTGESPRCLGSLGAGGEAAGIGGVEGCFGEEGLVSLNVCMVERASWPRRLAWRHD